MSFGHLPGAFLEIFFWFQKATLGTRLALNMTAAMCDVIAGRFERILAEENAPRDHRTNTAALADLHKPGLTVHAASSHVVNNCFILVSESNVRYSAGLKRLKRVPAP